VEWLKVPRGGEKVEDRKRKRMGMEEVGG